MTVPLLATKFFIPPGQPSAVPRPGLAARLEARSAGGLTLISAPAGFGKTTLLGQWLEGRDLQAAWISLDRRENDLRRFLAYWIAALKAAGAPIHEKHVHALDTPERIDIEATGTVILNQLSRLDEKITLVLDDYHVIENMEVHTFLCFILENKPPCLHLVIATRADPPIPLAKLRARGEMTEIRANDLRFNLSEGRAFLNQNLGLGLGEDELRILLNRTEGWPAGLQMASIALKKKTDHTGFITGFSGGYDFIADYLVDEVVQQQPEDVQDFLLKTSILDRLSPRLCDHLLDRKDSQEMLKYLKDNNLFLHALDEESRWFRYHHLFADLLQRRLLETQTIEEINMLYDRTSGWYEMDGRLMDAIEIALQGKRTTRAGAMLEEVVEPLLKRSEIATFSRWMCALPEDVFQDHPRLKIFHIWTMLINGEKLPGSGDPFAGLDTGEHPARAQLTSEMAAVRSMIALHQGNAAESVRRAREALEDLPPDDYFFRNIAAWNLSAALYLQGEIDAGIEALAEVSRMAQKSGNTLIGVVALSRQAAAGFLQGDLFRAKSMYEHALELARDEEGEALPIACEPLVGLGKVYWEMFDLTRAEENLQEGVRLSGGWRKTPAIEGYDTLACVYQALGDADRAEQMIDKAYVLARETTLTRRDERYISSQRALLKLRQGDLRAVERWARECGADRKQDVPQLEPPLSLGGSVIRFYERMVYARYLVRSRQYDDALLVLGELTAALNPFLPHDKRVEIAILRALAHRAVRKMAQALTSLREAVELARHGGYIRLFTQDGEALKAMLEGMQGDGEPRGFVDQILDAIQPVKAGGHTGSEGLVEPLSERELEVLRLMAVGMNNPEIADHLIIAVSTVRSHAKSIYGKLGVHSRFEAVSVAKDYNLV